MERLIRWIERLTRMGESCATACVLALVLLVFGNVVARYGFNRSAMALQELQWYFYGLSFLIAMAPTLLTDGHVRIDILYARLPARWQRWIDVWGTLLFLLPFTVLILWASQDFVAYSLAIREGSPNPGGLPAVYLFKMAIPLGFGLLLLGSFVFLWRRARGEKAASRWGKQL
ncbi:MAG: TRAP transporter small permease subunit [Candidatus Kapabacteria bacterium]|nr:TRAP transporter small permease subunit [Candidatus Kapabacteria bacterium]MCS7169433.1 TRAP transporter small permease subunit [Candidatus Kapabacteria bacterium]MDW7996836.1 TRAP transporter small permease subunit [Bacteroidota bacterium]MDW8225369.1 TRAP transporter small permease subunit [Bacteroidota bacterium]